MKGKYKNITVTIEKYDEEHKILLVEKQGASIWMNLSLAGFETDMQWFGIPTHLGELEGKRGYIFENTIDDKSILDEAFKFIDTYNLDNIKCIK